MSDMRQTSPQHRLAARLLVLALCAIPLAACDTMSSLNPFDRTEKYKPEIIPEVPADKIYNEGLARLANRDFEGAAKKFGEVDKQYPYSQWAKKSLLMVAYSNFERADYDETISASRRYVTLHPSSEDAAYAQFLLASSYYNQVPDVARDQERTEKAAAALQELIERYPRSEYVADARQKLLVVRDQLAGKDMTVGKYYLERRNYSGAINRYREVVAKYQTTRHVEEALMRLTEAYLALGVVNEAQTAAAVLGHNFPDSPWYRDAFKLLESGGLEPREDRGSWISRAFQGFTRTVGITR
jgi:outer membrane protein assembly factor BamD